MHRDVSPPAVSFEELKIGMYLCRYFGQQTIYLDDFMLINVEFCVLSQNKSAHNTALYNILNAWNVAIKT